MDHFDLLERARALSGCSLFESLAPAVLIRLAERARSAHLERGERRTTDDTVWLVSNGSLAVFVREPGAPISATHAKQRGLPAIAGNVLGMIRVVRDATPVVEIVAQEPSALVGLAIDDIRDVLEEDAAALTALSERLADLLLGDAP